MHSLKQSNKKTPLPVSIGTKRWQMRVCLYSIFISNKQSKLCFSSTFIIPVNKVG